jgi:hypothetical protein
MESETKFFLQTKVVILQARTEISLSKKRALSSVPSVSSTLSNYLNIVDGERREGRSSIEMLNAVIDECAGLEKSSQPILLFPSDKSLPLDVFLTDTVHTDTTGCTTLIVLDGSWKSVLHMLSRYTKLHGLPHVRLPHASSSRSLYEVFGLRKEPRRSFISTAESIALSLSMIEPSAVSTEACACILRKFESFLKWKVESESESVMAEIQGGAIREGEGKGYFDVDDSEHSDDDDDGESTSLDGDAALPVKLIPFKGVKEKIRKSKADIRATKRKRERRRQGR